MSQIKEIAKHLGDIEKEYALSSEEHEPNFGLVQVVYEWAQGKVSFDRGHPVLLIIKPEVYIYFNFSQSTTIFLVYIMFIIYNI